MVVQSLQGYQTLLNANLVMVQALWDAAQQQQRTTSAIVKAVAASLPGAGAQAAASWCGTLAASCDVYGQGLDQARRLAEAALGTPSRRTAGQDSPREGGPA
jgi:hypothetical protein